MYRYRRMETGHQAPFKTERLWFFPLMFTITEFFTSKKIKYATQWNTYVYM